YLLIFKQFRPFLQLFSVKFNCCFMTTFLLFNLIIQSINLFFKNLHYLSISFRFNVNIIWVFFLFTFSNIFKSIFLLIFIYSLNYFFYVAIFFNKRSVFLFYCFYIQSFNIIKNCLLTNF